MSKYFTYQVFEDIVLNGGAVAFDSQRREPLEAASYLCRFLLRWVHLVEFRIERFGADA